MLTATDQRVINFYTFINAKPRNSDGYFVGSAQNQTNLLYVMGGNSPMIQVWLPADLLDYANAAAGSSGERAVGIRVGGFASVKAAADEIQRIFSSPENLARFISSSECDYHEYVERKLAKQQPKIAMANDPAQGFWSKYSKEVMADLKAKNKDSKQLVTDFQTMTMVQFESKYALAA